MKKLLLFLLFTTGITNAQIVNIPDANFKALLTQTFCVADDQGYFISSVDTNSDGEIQLSEALAVHNLYANNFIYSISDLTGIEAFTNLKLLNCSGNLLTNLNISNLTQLEELSCSQNNLTDIHFPFASALRRIDCISNQLTAINTLALPNLEYLDCDNNQITSINLICMTHLNEFQSQINMINSLDLSGMTSLNIVAVGNNNLTNINLSGAINLKKLNCENNQLTSLNLTGLPNLNQLFCFGNQFSNIDVSQLISLHNLDCRYNQLTSLNLSALPNLNYVYCDWNENLNNINLSGASGLIELDCPVTHITTIDVSDSPNLSSLNLYWCLYLESLFVKNGSQEYINFDYCPQLNYICADVNQISNLQQTILNSNYIHYNQNCVINSYCSFTPGGNYNTIAGSIIFDANNNGCDSSDMPQPNIRVNINDGSNQGASFTNNSGNYNFFTQAGNFVLTPDIENATWFNFSPNSTNVSFVDNNNNTSTQNFCITANGLHNDAEVVISSLMGARPGFDATYKIVYKNKGNQTLSGNINFTYNDAVLDYISSSVTPDSQTTGNLNWNYTNLLPFESRSFYIVLHVNAPTDTPPVNTGDILNYTATINPIAGDETPADNVFAFDQTVVGSYDPNNKMCLEGDTVSTTKIGDYLHYNINFENTGTAAAENIVVKDIIDTTKFDINSLQIMNSSQPVTTRITGNAVEFIFQNINLVASQYGNVVFKIKTLSNLVTGDMVTNNANIYFDYNVPVATNTASTTFQTLSTGDFVLDNSVSISPNPTSSKINIHASSALKSIELFDVQGRVLETTVLANTNQSILDISSNANGIYFLKITTDKGSKVEKIVKE